MQALVIASAAGGVRPGPRGPARRAGDRREAARILSDILGREIPYYRHTCFERVWPRTGFRAGPVLRQAGVQVTWDGSELAPFQEPLKPNEVDAPAPSVPFQDMFAAVTFDPFTVYEALQS